VKKFISVFLFFIATFPLFAQNNNLITEGECGNSSFYEKELILQQQDIELVSNPKIEFSENWWQNFVFLIPLLVLTFLAVSFRSEIGLIFKSFFNQNIHKQLLGSQNNVFNNLIIVFNFLFFLIISAVISFYVFSERYFPALNYFFIFVIVVISVVAFYYLKRLVISLWAYIFEEKSLISLYSNNLKIANSILSLLLMFFLFFVIYNPIIKLNFIYFTFAVVAIVFFIRVFNVLREFFAKGFLLFYLILYLCTIEILPVFMLLSVVSD